MAFYLYYQIDKYQIKINLLTKIGKKYNFFLEKTAGEVKREENQVKLQKDKMICVNQVRNVVNLQVPYPC